MKFSKVALGGVSLLAAGALIATAVTASQAKPISVQFLMSAEMLEQQAFAGTYVTGGATSTINGSVLAGTYVTTGVSAAIKGSANAGTATTLGASSTVASNVRSGTATTLGAGAAVTGSVTSGTDTTFGEEATSGGNQSGIANSNVTAIASGQEEVLKAQEFLGLFGAGTTIVPGNIAADTTFTAGTYGVAGLLTVAANTVITLDANRQNSEFVFNISSYLTFGEGVTINVINDEKDGKKVHVSVIWNATGGYVSLGAGANIIGTILAKGYVSTGALSTLSGAPGNICGGAIYSATSYISIGAGATVGAGVGCITPPPYVAPVIPKG